MRAFLEVVTPEVRSRLLAKGRPWRVRAGDWIFSPSWSWRRIGVVEDGLARALIISSAGRQLTVRYARRGELVGNIVSIAGDRAPLAIVAVTACTGIEFDAADFRAIVEEDASVALLLLGALSGRLEDTYATLASSAFGTMRERIAAHLLHLGRADGSSGRIVVDVTQQQLADSVGSVREVVARTLHDLRVDGLIETATGRVVILDPPRLAADVGRWRIVAASAEPRGRVPRELAPASEGPAR